MNKLLVSAIVATSVIMVGCGQSEDKVSIGKKENLQKGMDIIHERQKQLAESDKLLDADIEKAKSSASQSKK